jgi:hypothetical protein
MSMFNTLEGKQIMFKMDDVPSVIVGRVVLAEDAGLWIDCKEFSDQLLAGFSARPSEIKKPIVFVPKSRFLWLISENSDSQE